MLSRKRVKIAKPDPETPYGAAEIDSLLASSAAAKTKVRRRYSRALIALGLAVGPFGGDYPATWSPPTCVGSERIWS